MRRAAVVALVGVGLVASSARAGLMAIGEAVEGNSWEQTFWLWTDDASTFNHVQVEMITAGDSFENPVIHLLPPSAATRDWSNDPLAPTVAWAQFSPVAELGLTVHFPGNLSDGNPLSAWVTAWNTRTESGEPKLMDTSRIDWNPSASPAQRLCISMYGMESSDQYQGEFIPEPTSVAVLACGLPLFALRRRRRR